MQNRSAVLGCFAAVAVGCGFMVAGPGGGGTDERAAVKKTVDTYVAAFVKGDGKAVCDQLTETARDAVIVAAGRVGGSDCITAVERSHSLAGRKVIQLVRKIRVGKVDVKGSTARVTLRAGDQDSVAELEKVDGSWKIASLPRA
jgi:hypothetical protein